MSRPDLDAAPLDLVERKAVLKIADNVERFAKIGIPSSGLGDALRALPSHPVQADAIAAVEARREKYLNVERQALKYSHDYARGNAVGRGQAADEILAILKSTRGAP